MVGKSVKASNSFQSVCEMQFYLFGTNPATPDHARQFD
jgi:hypothetical protein